MSVTSKPYSEYKDSGAPWLGKIPKHWQALPNRALFAEVNDRNHPAEPLLSVTISKGVIRQADLLADTSKKDSSNENKANYKLVQPRDIAYNKMRAWQGAVGVSNYRGIVSPAYIVVRLRGEQNPEYFHYLLRTPAFAKEAERWSYGITSDQWSLRAEDFKQIYCSLPPKEEQDRIVAFLTHFDHLINRLIRAKRRLIALLNEQKQVIIHRAVTRGLAPNVRLKPSGIDWLGDVPEHWEVSWLKFLASHIVDCLHATPEYVLDGEYPAIRTADIEPGHISIDTAKRVTREQYLLWTSRLVPQAGDVLYTREGERYGLAALVPREVDLCISQRMMLFRIRKPHSSKFVMWQLNCPHIYAQASADLIGATSPHVNVERIRNYALVVPPPKEQAEIAAWIEAHCHAIETGRLKAVREINLLHEYRTRLITDVVTGKLDVQGVELSALDEADALTEWEADEDTEVDEMDAREGVDA